MTPRRIIHNILLNHPLNTLPLQPTLQHCRKPHTQPLPIRPDMVILRIERQNPREELDLPTRRLRQRIHQRLPVMPHLVVLQVAGADAVVQPGELLGHAREVAGWAAAGGVAQGA